ncbi:hypothetical protein V1525DRAFT_403307 [Lipomyces kononenkoae]|uniref:Uncharacterized protein n=1 Tax=Lipomyces kononenkoae TaxID=34357 RepID=A0ACC3T1P5_LIPKO
MASHNTDMTGNEHVLFKHYAAFEAFVKIPPDSSLVPPSPRQAKSRERLHRMPRAPFVELSVDVYDELQRRQAIAAAKEAGLTPTVPDALPPQDGLHPKRNTTREHLAVLQASRFRDLVLDVYFEVARRLPQQPPEKGGAFKKPNPQGVQPSEPKVQSPSPAITPAQRPATSRTDSSGHSSNNSMSSNAGGNNFGRPLPRTFQTSTVVPTKSTMIERSDDSGDDDLAGPKLSSTRSPLANSAASGDNGVESTRVLDHSTASLTSSSTQRLPQAELPTEFSQLQGKHAALQVELTNLKDEISELKASLVQKDDQIRLLTETLENEKQRAAEGSSSYEGELFRNRAANMKMTSQIQMLEAELEKLSTRSASQHTVANSAVDSSQYRQLKENHDNLLADHEILKINLQDQHEVTEQVRSEVVEIISEMRALSELETANRESSDRLLSQVRQLQAENDELREKLALGQTPDTLAILDRKRLATRPSHNPANSLFVSIDGVISLATFAKFQASIDALVHASADANVASDGQSYFFETIRSVVTSVKNILTEADAYEQAGALTTATKLRSRVSVASNNLVLAAKNHALSDTLSPLSVLDASVASLVGCVVDLVKTAKLKEVVKSS